MAEGIKDYDDWHIDDMLLTLAKQLGKSNIVHELLDVQYTIKNERWEMVGPPLACCK